MDNKGVRKSSTKVESRNFDIRKTLLKFDNVLNDQRQVVFEQRRKIISMKRVLNFTDDFIDEINQDLIKEKQKVSYKSK